MGMLSYQRMAWKQLPQCDPGQATLFSARQPGDDHVEEAADGRAKEMKTTISQ